MTEVQGQLSFTDDISRDLELQEYGLDPAEVRARLSPR